MVSAEWLKLALIIIDQLAPFWSGKDHWIKLSDDTQFYKDYLKLAIEQQPVLEPLSKTFFLYKVLYKQKVHNLKNPEFCWYCHGLQDTQLDPYTRRKYLLHKVKLKKGFVQNLIFVLLHFNPEEEDQISKTCIHYISQEKVKNNINFMAGAWHNLTLYTSHFNSFHTMNVSHWYPVISHGL